MNFYILLAKTTKMRTFLTAELHNVPGDSSDIVIKNSVIVISFFLFYILFFVIALLFVFSFSFVILFFVYALPQNSVHGNM